MPKLLRGTQRGGLPLPAPIPLVDSLLWLRRLLVCSERGFGGVGMEDLTFGDSMTLLHPRKPPQGGRENVYNFGRRWAEISASKLFYIKYSIYIIYFFMYIYYRCFTPSIAYREGVAFMPHFILSACLYAEMRPKWLVELLVKKREEKVNKGVYFKYLLQFTLVFF